MAQIPTTSLVCNGRKVWNAAMPDFFRTLTTDEANSLQWEEITHIEHIVQKIDASLTWKDCRVEFASLSILDIKKNCIVTLYQAPYIWLC